MTGHTSSGGIRGPGQELRKTASIRDVAQAAGVSHQTVSRVINGHPSVREETRERVEAAIDTLGFRRNATAFALASGVTRAVTVLTSNTTLYGYAATLRGLEEAARGAGYTLGVKVLTPGDDLDRTIASASAAGGGGLLVIGFDRLGASALRRVPADVPCAAVVEAPPHGRRPPRPAVWADDREAARAATAYLLGLGHRTVHYVAIPTSVGARRSQGPRAQGWHKALQEAGVTPPEPHGGKGWDARAGYEVGEELARDPGVTAVLCGNDDLALGVLRALHHAGRRVPEDVSVIGFDDAPHSGFVTPALSTVRMDFRGLGRDAFALLRGQVESDYPPPARTSLGTELVVRESSGGWGASAAAGSVPPPDPLPDPLPSQRSSVFPARRCPGPRPPEPLPQGSTRDLAPAAARAYAPDAQSIRIDDGRRFQTVFTSRDVARLAGVSQSTVSYVMTGKRPISEETRRRVQAAIDLLSYQPNAGAQALASRRTRVIGLVVPVGGDLGNTGVVPFLETITQCAREADHDVLLVTADEGAAGLTRLDGRSLCDGIVLMVITADDERLPVIPSLRVPVVLIGIPEDPADLYCVDIDFTQAGRLAVQELAGTGHQRIVVIGHPPHTVARGNSFIGQFQRGVDERRPPPASAPGSSSYRNPRRRAPASWWTRH
ncbi:LacI family DNA-binding transcriptional regulator [Streptomyces adelaidensis]|uniref:LacI family DNA-binding transcriptional regulator n=1 Tax=Streptomyces adelaidensis TaxID=2796465 RepID=UPI0027DE7F1F|nr:LacI family DNA-binding transcriptional regulator [Streptomyces adelaidensis]